MSAPRPQQVYIVTITLVDKHGDEQASQYVFTTKPTVDMIRDAIVACNAYYTDYNDSHRRLLEVVDQLAVHRDPPSPHLTGWARMVSSGTVSMSEQDFFPTAS